MAQSSLARFAKTLSGAVAVATVLMSCDNGPSDVLKLEILGPSSLAPGASATYSVIEHRAGGTTRIAESATWTSSNRSVLEITRSGVATARSLNGETTLSVKASGLLEDTEVVVLPQGTFRVVGRVIDAMSGLGLSEARIEVSGGPAATTDISGAYRLYGVPANPEIRVTRHGYGVVVEPIQLTAHSTRDFRMLADTASVNYAGLYTLTLESACTGAEASPLRNDLRRRHYVAQILQYGASLEVRLSGARFSGDRFMGTVTAGGAMFVIHRDYEYADLTELLADGSLTIYGTSTTSGSPAGLAGPLVGGFQQFHPPPTNGFCPASTFSLVPR